MRNAGVVQFELNTEFAPPPQRASLKRQARSQSVDCSTIDSPWWPENQRVDNPSRNFRASATERLKGSSSFPTALDQISSAPYSRPHVRAQSPWARQRGRSPAEAAAALVGRMDHPPTRPSPLAGHGGTSFTHAPSAVSSWAPQRNPRTYMDGSISKVSCEGMGIEVKHWSCLGAHHDGT